MIRAGFMALLVVALQAQAKLVDPTRPQYGGMAMEKDAPVAARYQLQYLMVRAKSGLAVINGHRVVVGDVVDGARVERIRAGAVLLRLNGKRLELRMEHARIRRELKN